MSTTADIVGDMAGAVEYVEDEFDDDGFEDDKIAETVDAAAKPLVRTKSMPRPGTATINKERSRAIDALPVGWLRLLIGCA